MVTMEEQEDDEGSGSEGGSLLSIFGSGGMARAVSARKSLSSIMEESLQDQESKGAKLSLFDLLCIGIGSTIGTGVFVLTGKALHQAGPSAVVSWILAGLVCSLSSLSYMELSARLPTKGSCYVFSYHALGELAGVFGFACLTLEYGVSGAGVARSWSAKLASVMGTPLFWCYNGKTWGAGCDEDNDYYFDPLAALMVALCTGVVLRGMDVCKAVVNVFTVAKVCLVSFLVIAGFWLATGNMFESAEAFAPTGAGGVVKATTLLFFGYIGFDEVCCMASKARHPAKTMPKALAGTLIGAGAFSGLAQLALAAMVPYSPGMASTSFETQFHNLGLRWAHWLVLVGELVLLPLVVLLSVLPQPELTAAMAKDGLLPSLFRLRNSSGVYFKSTALIGAVLTLLAFAVPFSVLWDVISLGVLLSFNLTNAALINLRYGNGGTLAAPRVDALVNLLILATAVAAYTCQHGFAKPLFEGGEPNLALCAVSTLAGLVVSALAIGIHVGFPVCCKLEEEGIFVAPGVPFVPTLAMFCNFFLAATLPVEDFMYLFAFVCVVFAGYVAYKRHSRSDPPPVAAAPDGVDDGS